MIPHFSDDYMQNCVKEIDAYVRNGSGNIPDYFIRSLAVSVIAALANAARAEERANAAYAMVGEKMDLHRKSVQKEVKRYMTIARLEAEAEAKAKRNEP